MDKNFTVMNIQTLTKVLPTKGQLVYEYNPFRNYRCTQRMFEYKGDYYTLDQLYSKFKITPDVEKGVWLKNGNENSELSNDITLYEPGQLIDFITDELNFSLDHPVSILPQYSYDGSVNLILNDGITYPKLINSRFSATGQNTYEVVDRKGDNDTNIYDQGEQFHIDTSLFKAVNKIPKLEYKGTASGGNLKIGNYHFYLKLSDADGNETDYVAESGLVSIFIGFSGPSSITSGIKNENSYKSIKFVLSNIDLSYNYVTVYYSRYTAEGTENFNTEYAKINKKYIVSNSGVANISINGFEPTIPVTYADINDSYELVDAAKAQAQNQNMLFLGNVHKCDIPYDKLTNLSLFFLPLLNTKVYQCDIDENYILSSGDGYYSSEFIYNYTGYWNEEFYRLGVVYILPNGQLTPVFNIRGNTKISKDTTKDSYTTAKDNNYILQYNESNYLVINSNSAVENENVKGVVKLDSNVDTNIIHGFKICADKKVIQELRKYVKGFFFVRQARIPTILAQGITMGVDQESHTPTIATADGVLTDIADSLDGSTHVETSDINDVNYVSESFIHRYSFHFEKKHSGLFSSILKGFAIGVAIVGLAAATVFTCGAAGAIVAGATLAGAISSGVGALGTVLAVTGATAALAGAVGAVGATAIVAGTVGTVVAASILGAAVNQEIINSIKQTFAVKKLDGRNTECPSGYKIVEDDESRTITQTFSDRLIIKDASKNKVQAIICPDFEVNQPYFNQIFTGNKHYIELAISQSTNYLVGHSSNFFTNRGRHFYLNSFYDMGVRTGYKIPLIAVPDNTKCVGLNDYKFRSRAGYAEEAFRYECIGDDYKSEHSKNNADEDDETRSNKKINGDIIRGSFGAYLGMASDANNFSPASIVNIYIPDYSEGNINEYMKIRMDDCSPYQAISDRIAIQDLLTNDAILVGESSVKDFEYDIYRGDCYICQFTHRLNRNFQDPSAPYNDDIVDENTWRDHYDPENTEEYENINLGDVNAVQLGMWITFRLRSSYNLNIRSLDSSNVDEKQMTGHARGYYPYHPMSVEGTYKIPDSEVYNKGFSKSLSEQVHNLLPDVPYIKNWFGTRVMYSNLQINDAYLNGYRVFKKTHHRDYTREYGEITKLIPFATSLLIVFEHGVGIIEINSQAIANDNNALLTTFNVLPEKPTMLSDMFGSQWADSVIKTPGKAGDSGQYVYGVDTSAKKIWMTDGSSLTCISDFRVQEFLNNNITLDERELTPQLGIKNVKTFYNAYKRDVMFTFYDNTYGFQEKVWNLCWNEVMQKFVTFYSWVPSFMENIDNIPFSFNRDVSKWIAKLGVSHSENSFADGITLTNTTFNTDKLFSGNPDELVNNFTVTIPYTTKLGEETCINATVKDKNLFIGALSLSNRTLPTEEYYYTIEYKLARDNYKNYTLFDIKELELQDSDGNEITQYPLDAKWAGQTIKVYGLYLKKQDSYSPKIYLSELYYRNKEGHAYADYDTNKAEVGTIHTDLPIFKNKAGQREVLPEASQINADKIVRLLNISATINIDTSDEYTASYNKNTKLINYGQYESTVSVMPEWNMQFLSTDFWKHGQAGSIDISDDLYPTYWYGKQHPFEFEVIVVNDPSVHKIFTNLELIANKAKPESFHYEVVGESYDFAKDKANMYFRQEALKALWQYNGCDIEYNNNFLKIQPKQQNKSADLPHTYYARQDRINEVYDSYVAAEVGTHDYRHLSGAEIVYYPLRQEYRVWNHALAVDLDEQKDTTDSAFGGRGLIASNMRYIEDRWRIQINPLVVAYKNEYTRKDTGYLFTDANSTWTYAEDEKTRLPKLSIYNSPIPSMILEKGEIEFPDTTTGEGSDNALYGLYSNSYSYIDESNWLNDSNIYNTSFGSAQNRKEADMRDKFIKIRIRYSGKELAVIDYLNTIYQVSYI